MRKRKPGERVVEWTKGMCKSNVPPATERELKDAAEQAIADSVWE